MNTFQAKSMIERLSLIEIQLLRVGDKLDHLERIADVLEKLEARSDHFLVALSSVST